ncbi:curli production assembly/transport component CsgF [Flavobacterium sp. GT3P67]|uniref:curli production assembly/transport component CsgF n=1 Tax=Flavobacterium sp. GT3P67 TaxID=2541722 RepID=UPI001046D9A7|nr:curli production assembly/transport component CsgF [Flavobacterium sp. GT3P67]TDE48467.1 curli assembly protein CsgF [Flavobacterium sp. GT3P67]
MKVKFLIGIMLVSLSLKAQGLVYKPINPAFGGDTFNYQWLLSSAESQKTFKEKVIPTVQKTDLQKFTDQLNSQFLSQVSREMFAKLFGSNGFSVGSYNFGSFSVEIYHATAGLTLDILDTSTGDQTQVIIPNK